VCNECGYDDHLKHILIRKDAFTLCPQSIERSFEPAVSYLNNTTLFKNYKSIQQEMLNGVDDVVKHLDLDTIIYPKNITSDMILRYVRAMKKTIGSNVETLYSVIKGKIEAAEFFIKENSGITDKPLAELKLKKDMLIAAIFRGKTVIIPRGSDVIQKGDSVVIVSRVAALHDIDDILM
jgi:trk system potassium uptake protein TrkA